MKEAQFTTKDSLEVTQTFKVTHGVIVSPSLTQIPQQRYVRRNKTSPPPGSAALGFVKTAVLHLNTRSFR